jgi:glycosyltransferase involved in cell wall biosynthesis
VVVQLAKAMRASGREVSVVSMLSPTAFIEELRSAQIPVKSLDMRVGRPNIAAALRFFAYVHRFRPDLIHGHMFHASILSRMAQLFLGIPAVCTVHNEIECSHRRTSAPLREAIYRMTDAACRRTTAVSERVRQRYIREKIVPSHRIEMIANGVDIHQFRPCAEQRDRIRAALGWRNTFVWLAVGRLELAKDYPTLIRAFRNVHAQSPSTRLAIAGEGRCRREIEQLIAQFFLSDAVSLLGLRNDVPDLMNACDALVMCSAWEGGPLVVLEAAAVGKPVVATGVGVAPEAVVHGRTGLLVPPGDPDALAGAMKQLMQLAPEALHRMGESGRQHVMERYSLDSVHQRYANLYEQVLAVAS